MRLIISRMTAVLLCMTFLSCEEEITPDTTNLEPDIVVEGFIESGENALPTYVLVSRSFPFYRQIGADQLDEIIVKDAEVTVRDRSNGNIYPLTKICLDQLNDDLKRIVAALLGISLDSSGMALDICAYVDVTQSIDPKEGGFYDLEVLADGKTITAETSIPFHVPLDSVWFTEPPGKPNDTLAEMNCRITDPGDRRDYYRYLTAEENSRLISSFGSVTDDAFFNGLEFNFPLSKAEDPNGDDVDFETFGLWTRGDTALLKWCSIDKAHHDFWLTFEFNRNNQGPFSSYTSVSSNINGGLGIWGGQSVSYYEQLVPLK